MALSSLTFRSAYGSGRMPVPSICSAVSHSGPAQRLRRAPGARGLGAHRSAHRSTAACRAVTETEAAQINTQRAPVETWKWKDSSDAQRAYLALAAVLAVGTDMSVQGFGNASLFYFVSLAVCTIYIGAHKGVTTPNQQQISFKQGLFAPIAASVALFGGYLVLKYFPDLSLQSFFDVYFWLVGSFAISGAAASLLQIIPGISEKSINIDLPSWLLIDEQGKPIEKSNWSPADVLGGVIGVALASAELAGHHTNFTLSNLIACLVATDILQLIGLRSFKTASVLLTGLLVYDVFWVFGSESVVGTNVMMSMATSTQLNAPTRLLFPRVSSGRISEAATFPYSLLGLGDIAVPGLLACLALRYDASRIVDLRGRAPAALEAIDSAIKGLDPDADGDAVADAAQIAAFRAFDDLADADDARRDASTSDSDSEGVVALGLTTDALLYQRRYFTAVMCAYIVGLLAAFEINALTGAGQPALLYLVPCTLGAVLAMAASRGEVSRVWSYSDLPSSLPGMAKPTSEL